MAARLMMNYPSIVSCDEETYKAAISKLSKQDFEMLPFKPMKGIAEPGVIREYTKDHEYVIMPEVVYFLVGLASQNHTMFAPGFSIFKFAKIITILYESTFHTWSTTSIIPDEFSLSTSETKNRQTYMWIYSMAYSWEFEFRRVEVNFPESVCTSSSPCIEFNM